MDQRAFAKKIVTVIGLLRRQPLTPKSLAGQMHVGLASAYRRLEATEKFLLNNPEFGTLNTKPVRQGERGPAGRAYYVTAR